GGRRDGPGRPVPAFRQGGARESVVARRPVADGDAGAVGGARIPEQLGEGGAARSGDALEGPRGAGPALGERPGPPLAVNPGSDGCAGSDARTGNRLLRV